MNEFFSKKPIIEHTTQEFLNHINSHTGAPIYDLSPEDARSVLIRIQDIELVPLLADIEDKKIHTGPTKEINIRIVRPKNSKSKLPAVMYFHGGGWILGDKNVYDRLVREISIGANAAVIFVDYFQSPEAQYPIAIEEAYAATKYISENGSSLNIDSSRLAVAGDSVGANMATVVALLSKNRGGPKIDYQVLFYPVTDADFETESYKEFKNGYWLSRKAMKWFWNAYLPDEKERKAYTASPLHATIDQLTGLPATLIFTNEYDVLRDEGEAYARKLIEANVNTTAVRLLGTIHDCIMLNALASTPAVRAAIELATIKLRLALNS